jgi:hypothetical protein
VTLAISVAHPDYALHVSDRLVTNSATRDPLDPAANKVLVMLARNGIVCLAHVGLAALGSGPAERSMDHWIAERLAGRSLGPAVTSGPRYKFDVGYAIRSLCAGLDQHYELFAKHHTEIQGCGFQWPVTGRPLTHTLTVSIEASGGRFEAEQRVYRKRGRPWASCAVIPNVPSVDGQRLLSELQAVDFDPHRAEMLMLDSIRAAAASSDVIGTDCMSVLVKDSTVFIKYRGERPTVGHGFEAPATPTPWLLTPWTIAAPMASCMPQITLGALKVIIAVPDADIPSTEVAPGVKRILIPGFEMQRRTFGPPQPVVPPPPVDEETQE